MKNKIKTFLNTDLLEKYLLGTTTEEETLRTERYIAMYPEVRDTYNELQENLETFAKLHALKTPLGLEEQIMRKVKRQKKGQSKFMKFAVAASIIACLFAGSAYFLWDQNQSLQEENAIVNTRIKDLEADMNQRLEDVRNQFIVLNNPQTKQFEVKGNKKAKELKAVAYVNPVKKLSFINVKNLPNLPEEQCFQMWAEVNGEMVNMGVINRAVDKDKLLALPYADHAIGYITIEPKGGNHTPSVENIVANINF